MAKIIYSLLLAGKALAIMLGISVAILAGIHAFFLLVGCHNP